MDADLPCNTQIKNKCIMVQHIKKVVILTFTLNKEMDKYRFIMRNTLHNIELTVI